MNKDQIKLLTKIKKLVSSKSRRFEDRDDIDYLEELAILGISEEEAWNHILSLNVNFYFPDPKPNYYNDKNSLTFKKSINGKLAYIKVNINEDEVKAICWSFHEDRKERK